MRKRNFVCGIALCLALSVAGCGKSSEEQQAVNYYQNELGLDKEDAEELAHAIYGGDEEEPGVTGEETSVTEEVQEETVIEPLPELVDSEWYERKVQILDMVFTRDEHLTEEVIREIVEGSAYDVELSETFDQNGDVCLDGIMLDGTRIVYLSKRTRSVYASVGLLEDGDYYDFGNGHIYLENNWYDKRTMEVEALDFKTRDDVLAYLAENGFVEVEEKQAPYANTSCSGFSNNVEYVPNGCGAEFADVPHYYSKGAQSIAFFRVHKLNENDQEIKFVSAYYSGCQLNLYECVHIEFNTDGTISSMKCTETMPCLMLGEHID